MITKKVTLPKEVKQLILNAELTKKEEAVAWALRRFNEYLRRYVGNSQKDAKIYVWPLPVTKVRLVQIYQEWQTAITNYDDAVEKLI